MMGKIGVLTQVGICPASFDHTPAHRAIVLV